MPGTRPRDWDGFVWETHLVMDLMQAYNRHNRSLFPGVTMALAQLDRDQEIWRAWVQGMTQDQIAAQRGVTQPAISQAISRYLASIPEPERAAYRARTLERLEALYQAHAATALERPRVAAIVRGILDSQARVLGLVQTQVQHSGQVDHAHAWTPGPSVAEVLDDWRRRGILRAEITRPGEGP